MARYKFYIVLYCTVSTGSVFQSVAAAMGKERC